MARPEPIHSNPNSHRSLRSSVSYGGRLNKYIMANGGWIVSEPDTSTIRFECSMDSALPELLRQAGHNVRNFGRHERLLPSIITERRGTKTVTSQVVAPGVVAVYEFGLPSADPRRQVVDGTTPN
jgi:hypothetical protein